jgi:hypothetical protein
MELLQSDVSYDQHHSLPDSPAVKLQQSDEFRTQRPKLSSTQPQTSSSKPLVGKSSGENRAVNLTAEPSGQIDIISTEMTHDALDAPLDVRGSVPPPDPSSEVSDPRSRWLFVLAGLSAAVISAALTWFLVIGPQRSQRVTASPEDLAQAVDLGSPPDLQPSPVPIEPSKPTSPDGDKPKTLPVEGKQRASAGQVLIRSEPPGATVLVDKQPVGETPLILADRTVGEDFKIELTLDGYKKGRKRIKWKSKDRLEIKVKLQSIADEAASTDVEKEDAK